jgi:hypothetical protein
MPTSTPAMAADSREGGSNREPALLLPSPLSSSVLAVLPSLELSALESALDQFVEHMRQTGQRLTDHSDEIGLCPWIVAAAAAFASLEIGRRQMKRSADSPTEEARQMVGLPLNNSTWGRL